MATATAIYASGRVISANNGKIIFAPTGTNYELELVCHNYTGPMNKSVQGTIRVRARKVWTVPSGGNFITPIIGPPKIIQGRVRSLDQKHLVVHAGTAITIELPDDDKVFDLANGAITESVMVNVTAFGKGEFEPATL